MNVELRERDKRPEVAFVLGGGGSYGAAQAGALYALAEAGIRPDMIVGTSVGAFNGAMFADGGDEPAAARLKSVWQQLKRRDILPLRPLPFVAGICGRRNALFSNAGLRRLVQSHIPYRRLEDAPIPFYATSTDLADSTLVVLSEGDVAEALVASAAIPGVFPPVALGDHLLVDGAVAADLAVEVAVGLGATVVYVLRSALRSGAGPDGALAVAQRATDHFIEERNNRQLLAAAHVDLHLSPVPSTAISTLDFRASDELWCGGYELTGNWLAARPDPVGLSRACR